MLGNGPAYAIPQARVTLGSCYSGLLTSSNVLEEVV